MVFKLLKNQLIFPEVALAEPDGLLAIGGDLSLERLVLAYKKGIFPWFSEGEPILWYAPHQRCVIYPAKVKISKNMLKILKANTFKVTVNKAFAAVIKNCAQTPRTWQNGTWINTQMQEAYLNLHQKGWAHSVEVWQNDVLVGGLYGLKINQVFCGESMFSLVSNASKIALIYLCQNLNFNLVDCQLPNPHLISLGAEMIANEEYLRILQNV
jgi:leucyl/phenylalanyl-tRNA---protein transferase